MPFKRPLEPTSGDAEVRVSPGAPPPGGNLLPSEGIELPMLVLDSSPFSARSMGLMGEMTSEVIEACRECLPDPDSPVRGLIKSNTSGGALSNEEAVPLPDRTDGGRAKVDGISDRSGGA